MSNQNDTDKYILGVKISSTPKSRLLIEIEKEIKSGSKFSITTVGPEILLMAQENTKLKNALNSATFSIPDGVGLKLAEPSLQIIKGRELFLDLVKLSAKFNWKVFLLGGLDNEAKIVSEKYGFYYAGGKDVNINLTNDLINKINKFNPDLLFIAFSHPDQELFISKYQNKLNAKCIMTVGGTFRYLAGTSKLPPTWIAGWGEWLWRLLTEPKRIKRIFNATVLFPIEVLKSKVL